MDNEIKAWLYDILNENITISYSRNIVDLRNRIIHGYDSVSDQMIWGVLISFIPILQVEVETLLGE